MQAAYSGRLIYFTNRAFFDIICIVIMEDKNMATIMQKDVLISLLARANSAVMLKLEPSEEYDRQIDFLAAKGRYVYTTAPEEIDFDNEAAIIREIINRYQNLPTLPQFQ